MELRARLFLTPPNNPLPNLRGAQLAHPSMTTRNCHPPSRHQVTRQVSPSKALSVISNYLLAAGTDASRHPNALFTKAGMTTPSSGTHQFGLVLHNLKRVEASLRGERLIADLILDSNGEVESHGLQLGAQGLLHDSRNSFAGNTEGWQEKAEFEREQDIHQGEIGGRDNAAGAHADWIGAPNVRIEGAKSATEKGARRKRKEKRLQERRNVQAKKQAKDQSKD